MSIIGKEPKGRHDQGGVKMSCARGSMPDSKLIVAVQPTAETRGYKGSIRGIPCMAPFTPPGPEDAFTEYVIATRDCKQ